MLYGRAVMSRTGTRSWAYACRRWLAVMVCALMVLTGLGLDHASARGVAASPDLVAAPAAFMTDDATPVAPDFIASDPACHCACKLVAMPAPAPHDGPALVCRIAFTPLPPSPLRPGVLIPPSEPPRT